MRGGDTGAGLTALQKALLRSLIVGGSLRRTLSAPPSRRRMSKSFFPVAATQALGGMYLATPSCSMEAALSTRACDGASSPSMRTRLRRLLASFAWPRAPTLACKAKRWARACMANDGLSPKSFFVNSLTCVSSTRSGRYSATAKAKVPEDLMASLWKAWKPLSRPVRYSVC